MHKWTYIDTDIYIYSFRYRDIDMLLEIGTPWYPQLFLSALVGYIASSSNNGAFSANKASVAATLAAATWRPEWIRKRARGNGI